jgi:hypothetical protein
MMENNGIMMENDGINGIMMESPAAFIASRSLIACMMWLPDRIHQGGHVMPCAHLRPKHQEPPGPSLQKLKL